MVPQAGQEPVQRVEDEVVGPMQIGEHDHQWRLRGEAFEACEHRSQGVFACTCRVDSGPGDPLGEVEDALGGADHLYIVGVALQSGGGGIDEVLADGADRVSGLDAEGLADHLDDRSPGPRVAVGGALAREDSRRVLALSLTR